jgi:hypothetical protein
MDQMDRDSVDGLARFARRLGLAVSRDDLRSWAPLIRGLDQDVERLRNLPIDQYAPAFVPILLARDVPRDPEA